MKRVFSILALAALSVFQEGSDARRLLAWVESASPAQYFERDSRNGEFRFYQTFGFSSEIPSVGLTSYRRCYAGVVAVQDMVGTRDYFTSEREMQLDHMAKAFAAEYNRRMKEFVDGKGLSRCPRGTDWEGFETEFNQYVWGDDKKQGVMFLAGSEQPARLKFALIDVNRADDIRTKSCDSLVKFGIRDLVSAQITEWLRGSEGFKERPLGSYMCKNGTASELVAK